MLASCMTAALGVKYEVIVFCLACVGASSDAAKL